MEIILSSSKRGYGLRELMSDSLGEFWNSDDTLPHSISVSFFKKTYVYSINIQLLYTLDESYTPEKVAVYYNDKSRIYNLKEPEGENALIVDSFVFDVHIVILSNHSDGKDSHIRRLKVMSSPTECIKYDMEKFF